MRKLNRFRQITRIAGIISGIIALVGILSKLVILAVAGLAVLVVDIVIIAIYNKCPDCGKSLPFSPPATGEEFCIHCGSKIE